MINWLPFELDEYSNLVLDRRSYYSDLITVFDQQQHSIVDLPVFI